MNARIITAVVLSLCATSAIATTYPTFQELDLDRSVEALESNDFVLTPHLLAPYEFRDRVWQRPSTFPGGNASRTTMC